MAASRGPMLVTHCPKGDHLACAIPPLGAGL